MFPVIYRFYGHEKLVNWLIKEIEAVKKELECKVSVLVSKKFRSSANWREKKAKFNISCRK